MMKPEIQKLADAVLDGTASEAERVRFEALLASDPSAREAWDDLRAAERALATAGLAEPPSDMRAEIARAVNREAERGVARGGLQSLIAGLMRRPGPALGYAFAAGLAVGVLGLAPLVGGLREARDAGSGAVGTLAPGAGSHELVTLAGARVDITTTPESQGASVRLAARSEGSAEIALEWDPSRIDVESIRWPESPAAAVSLTPGRLMIDTDHSATAAIQFRTITPSGESILRVTVRSGDQHADHVVRLPR